MVMDMYKNKEVDPFTGKQISKKTYWRALKVAIGFTNLALEKSNINPVKKAKIAVKLQKRRKVDYTPTAPADH
jgi:hypothetical protein